MDCGLRKNAFTVCHQISSFPHSIKKWDNGLRKIAFTVSTWICSFPHFANGQIKGVVANCSFGTMLKRLKQTQSKRKPNAIILINLESPLTFQETPKLTSTMPTRSGKDYHGNGTCRFAVGDKVLWDSVAWSCVEEIVFHEGQWWVKIMSEAWTGALYVPADQCRLDARGD